MAKVQDKEYWENYYRSGSAPADPSLFAQHIIENYAQVGQRLYELGCGNGRDAHYFASRGIDVMAIDQCASEIEQLVSTNGQFLNLHYLVGDFTSLDDVSEDDKFDLIYSRFTLHSITEQEQQKTLIWCYNNLRSGGLLCVETRGQKNEIYQKGLPVDGQDDAYVYEGHYRRFVDFESFVSTISCIGFKAIEASEQPGYAPFKDTDYHFIRVVAQK